MRNSSSGKKPDNRGIDGAPTCPHARACGACQHVNEPYAAQLARKDARVAELFGGIDGAELRPILGMDDPYRYRNKVVSPYAPGKKLAAAPSAGKAAKGKGSRGDRARDARDRRAAGRPRHEILCGMYAAHSHRIVPTDECLVENEEAKRVILAIRSLMPRFGMEPYREDAGSGFLRHAVVRVGHTSGEMLVTLVTNGREFPGSRAFCRELVKRCPGVTTIVQNVNERQTNVILGEREQTLYGPGFILDQLCGLSFRISSQSFYQVNAVQTEVLYRQAVELAGFTGTERAVDAYCGTGTIGLVAAKHGAAQVTGVDSVASAVRDARENARHNGVENARFVVDDAGAFMRKAAAEGERPDVVLMDPPRAGSSEEFLESLAACAPMRVVYISCNPETQARDVRHLERRGYRLRVLQPVDMFPHTDHIETIALLQREGGR
ncbi:23S rRNA (uracil(1939)-C(5))-methyltransferase RlmD [Gordonibacter massiliensis (ex Traore et al. 2017)]|uniref:23S rRNA (Uracil(1939)-C(5))-methyltransferase RlmD n=1 Tax=Gordonibacter massiliensis (ex Traore et al. 2017) TaxID=1841863 RepID=A0A842J9T4_9ACTN|nr:23S rRNA (uracil(1939)-C(5))-methyltransferase RlmD [Gordonibacter massiliensis (ex Traore et al. 2017)]MBC2888497.1 23S rRNA (uracil(1939)-C(5))-methyltransferase RlmD [Gordonibacter massiliensis (ex Traore et al. 2017)]